MESPQNERENIEARIALFHSVQIIKQYGATAITVGEMAALAAALAPILRQTGHFKVVPE